MIKKQSRAEIREKRHWRMRHKISGTAECPRLAVFRSNKHMYAQIIDDVKKTTLASAATVESELVKDLKTTSDVEAAKAVGAAIAKRASEKGVTKVVFDRGGHIYHGRVAAVADAAREAGLQF